MLMWLGDLDSSLLCLTFHPVESCQFTVYKDPTSRDAQLSHLCKHSDSVNTIAAIFLPCLSIASSPCSKESDVSASVRSHNCSPHSTQDKMQTPSNDLQGPTWTRSLFPNPLLPLFVSLSIPASLLFLLFHEPRWGPALAGPLCKKSSLQASQSQFIPCVQTSLSSQHHLLTRSPHSSLN